MEVYLYKAYDFLTQRKVKGEMEGESQESVRKSLIAKNLYPQSIKLKNKWNSEIEMFKMPVRLREIHFFCQQLTTMLRADISIVKSLEICRQQTTHKTLAKHIEKISFSISIGKTFSQAVEEEKIFPDVLIQLIISGELSGHLEEAMERALEYLEQQLMLRKKVKKALAYPMLVLAIIGVVLIILMTKVVPAYIKLLNDTGAHIPLPTQIIIQLSHFMVHQWMVLVVGIGILVGFILNAKRIPSIKRIEDCIFIKIPIFGELRKKYLAAIFSSTMSMLIASGIPILQAMEITKNVMDHTLAQEEMNHAITSIRQGKRLLEALEESTIFSPLLLSMIGVGEESGTLDEILAHMGLYFKEEVERVMDQLILFIEPIMLVVIAIIIGGIMAAIMLPTFSAVTTVM